MEAKLQVLLTNVCFLSSRPKPWSGFVGRLVSGSLGNVLFRAQVR